MLQNSSNPSLQTSKSRLQISTLRGFKRDASRTSAEDLQTTSIHHTLEALEHTTMYAIRSQKQPNGSEPQGGAASFTPNVLPCRIHHDGPVESIQRFWVPVADEGSNTETSHFRGRRLRGRRVAVPEGYQGIVAVPTEDVLPAQKSNGSEPEDMDVEPEEPVKVLQKQGAFDEFMVWGHESVPAANDPFVKGVEEWVKLAEAMHSTTPLSQQSEKESST